MACNLLDSDEGLNPPCSALAFPLREYLLFRSLGLGRREPLSHYPAAVAHLKQSTRYQSRSLPRPARELATFLAAVAIVIDLVLLAIGRTTGAMGGSGQSGEAWKEGKTVLLLLGLAVLALASRSPGIAVSVVLLALFFMEDWGLTGYRVGSQLPDIFDLAHLDTLVPAPPDSWGEFLALGGLALLTGVTLILSGLYQNPPLRRGSLVLAGLVVLLFAFAGAVDLFADAYPHLPLRSFEELGTLLILSLALGYTGGLLLVALRWPIS
jgi:hypothetical protein